MHNDKRLTLIVSIILVLVGLVIALFINKSGWIVVQIGASYGIVSLILQHFNNKTKVKD